MDAHPSAEPVHPNVVVKFLDGWKATQSVFVDSNGNGYQRERPGRLLKSWVNSEDVIPRSSLRMGVAVRGHPYWQWFEASLKADSRAVGGEPCRMCSRPIPAATHWLYRDRHVCSSRCNDRLKDQLPLLVLQGQVPRYRKPASYREALRCESLRTPRIFRTDPSAEFPYEHGRWPVIGDVIERHGHLAVYLPFKALPHVHQSIVDEMRARNIPEERTYIVLHANSGAYTAWFTRYSGNPRRFKIGRTFFGMEEIEDRSNSFMSGGQRIYCYTERITDVDEDGLEFVWEAQVFTPVRHLAPLWTPARYELSAKRSRISRARSAYLARMRALGVVAEADRVDPQDIYERDDWICGLCGEDIDPESEWPDPYVATLDHIKPVTHFGAHSSDNLQAAHWICNVSKGNRA